MNKLGANMQCIMSAEQIYLKLQEFKNEKDNAASTEGLSSSSKPKAHIDLAAG